MSSASKHHLVLVRHGRSIANEENRIISDPTNGAIDGQHDSTKKRYGLSSAGKAMVAESAASLADYIDAYSQDNTQLQIHIVCSPFDRTRDTADIVFKGLQAKWALSSEYPAAGASASAATATATTTTTTAATATTANSRHRPSDRVVRMGLPIPHSGLVERFFGDFEGQAPSTALYEAVWAHDALDPGHREHGVESLEQVMARQRQVLGEWGKTTRMMGAGAGAGEQEDKVEKVEKWIVYVGHGDPLQILQTNMKGWALERHRELNHHEVAEWRHVEWCTPAQAEHYCIAPIDGTRQEQALAASCAYN
ncbi:hypothetical protein DFQ27_000761 [Actinomortierella ambigua]|uniref:Phosphoglycerate mutase-like protein n=1 Tax=Actinomortierella ambigua TaxID=1343610 RepID=A0A9P6QG87_9FUNG|nr:hypothetical protein DFQ27_000761 [Actinomortierella ambigua]